MKLFNRIIPLSCFLILLFASFFVYFYRYGEPNKIYWDENYHIVSAEKYLKNSFFLECHPPLGKLILAGSEKLFGLNEKVDKSSFLSVDYIKNVPDQYNFAGIRFLPTLFGVLCSLLIFILIFLISKNSLLSLLGGFLYIFDTAMLLHFRGAMLDSFQLFFVLLALIFLAAITKISQYQKTYLWILLGIFIGAAIATKLNAMFLLLIYPILLAHFFFFREKLHLSLSKFVLNISLSLFSLVILFMISMYCHFALTGNLVENRDYDISDKAKEIILTGKSDNILHLPTLTLEYIKYINNYNKAVPKYDPEKIDENGSLPLSWPFGIKPIRYRYDSNGTLTRYLYLVPNPIVWSAGLLGVLSSFAIIISNTISKIRKRKSSSIFLITSFLLLYLGYMISVSQIDRVMYLYHYFIPLVLSIILFIFSLWYAIKNKFTIILFMIIFFTFSLSMVFFLKYNKLSYHLPLKCEEIKSLEIIPAWDLKCPANK